MLNVRKLSLPVLLAAVVATGAAGCGDTWVGAKEDTRRNVEKTGEGVEDLGEKIQDQAD